MLVGETKSEFLGFESGLWQPSDHPMTRGRWGDRGGGGMTIIQRSSFSSIRRRIAWIARCSD